MAVRWREKEMGTLTSFGFGLSSGSSTSTVPSEADDMDLKIQARTEAAVSYVASSVFTFK